MQPAKNTLIIPKSLLYIIENKLTKPIIIKGRNIRFELKAKPLKLPIQNKNRA